VGYGANLIPIIVLYILKVGLNIFCEYTDIIAEQNYQEVLVHAQVYIKTLSEKLGVN
jgi:hypothetical protein